MLAKQAVRVAFVSQCERKSLSSEPDLRCTRTFGHHALEVDRASDRRRSGARRCSLIQWPIVALPTRSGTRDDENISRTRAGVHRFGHRYWARGTIRRPRGLVGHHALVSEGFLGLAGWLGGAKPPMAPFAFSSTSGPAAPRSARRADTPRRAAAGAVPPPGVRRPGAGSTIPADHADARADQRAHPAWAVKEPIAAPASAPPAAAEQHVAPAGRHGITRAATEAEGQGGGKRNHLAHCGFSVQRAPRRAGGCGQG